jgi:Uma2 family endonuclease
MGLPATKDDRRYTYADFLTWPDEERWELIDGVPFDMSPAPGVLHQRVLREFLMQIANYLKDKSCEVLSAPLDVRLPIENERDELVKNVVQPDIIVVCEPSKLDKRGCRGAPDLVIEILSPHTSRKDRMIKFNTYEQFGVKEYWLVAPEDKTVEVFSLGEGDNPIYGRPQFYNEGQSLPSVTVDGLVIELADVFPE